VLVNDLCKQAVTKKSLTLCSSGTQKRDFITLQDVSRAALHFIGLPRELCRDGLFNLGGESSFRIIDMANLDGLVKSQN
jgi:UDP-glucose 4-epimerase